MNQNSYRMGGFTPAFALITVGLGLASTSCFGDDSANHVLSDPPMPGTILMFDNFEIVEAANAVPASPAPFAGGWYIFDDGSLATPEGGMKPEGQQVVRTEALDDPHNTVDGASEHGLHMFGGPYTGSYGSGVTGQLNSGTPYDASAYTGIMLWAKKGVTSEQSAVSLSLATINDTYQEGGVTCKDPPTPNKNDGCNDGFHIALALRQKWTLYIIPFGDLVQQGYGYKPPGGFAKNAIIGVNFLNKQGAIFDQWIDDIAFYK